MNETDVINLIRIEASELGLRLWRNNVGATLSKDGRIVRYGLANESSKMNSLIKSADLIGINPILITEGHIGTTIGQFVSREAKEPNWKYRGIKAEKAQAAWRDLIRKLGGDAEFAVGLGSFNTIEDK
jgi:hypothetical protein